MIEAGEGASRQGRGRARGRNSAGHRLSDPGGEGVREDEDIREEVDEEDEEGPIPELIPVGSDSDDDEEEEEGVGNEEEEGEEEEDEDLRQRLVRL